MCAVDWEDTPNTVRVLDANEAAWNTIALEEPVVIRGAFDRAKATWGEVWLTKFMQDELVVEPAGPTKRRHLAVLRRRAPSYVS